MRHSFTFSIFRSNFKGDVKRHIQKSHENVPNAHILLMPDAEAAATLDMYNARYLGRRKQENDTMGKRTYSVPTPLSGNYLLTYIRYDERLYVDDYITRGVLTSISHVWNLELLWNVLYLHMAS